MPIWYSIFVKFKREEARWTLQINSSVLGRYVSPSRSDKYKKLLFCKIACAYGWEGRVGRKQGTTTYWPSRCCSLVSLSCVAHAHYCCSSREFVGCLSCEETHEETLLAAVFIFVKGRKDSYRVKGLDMCGPEGWMIEWDEKIFTCRIGFDAFKF